MEGLVKEDIRRSGIRFVEDSFQLALILVQADNHFGLSRSVSSVVPKKKSVPTKGQ